MRYRTQSHTSRLESDRVAHDLLLGTDGTPVRVVTDYVDMESHMWDDPTGGNRVNKPCIHMSYLCGPVTHSFDGYDTGDFSNSPGPRTRYTGRTFPASYINRRRPGSLITDHDSYIPVTGNTLDDISNCVFQAYNQYIIGVTALDASVSIAESGETPQLFQMWQRRRALPSNLVNGFLAYSFGWKPLLSDLRAIAKEMRSFPTTVRKRLKAIGDGNVVRRYKFDLTNTVNDLSSVIAEGGTPGYSWTYYKRDTTMVHKSRIVVVTIRAKVKPKLSGHGQDIVNRLGALGLIPSLATLWAVTRLSFVVDWFYNVGGAIENLQGSMTHDVSDVSVTVSDTRTARLVTRVENCSGPNGQMLAVEDLRSYKRSITSVPLLPQLRIPQRPMQYVLLGLLALTNTKRGKLILRSIDGIPIIKRMSARIEAAINKLSPRKRSEIFKTYGDVIPGFRRNARNSR